MIFSKYFLLEHGVCEPFDAFFTAEFVVGVLFTFALDFGFCFFELFDFLLRKRLKLLLGGKRSRHLNSALLFFGGVLFPVVPPRYLAHDVVLEIFDGFVLDPIWLVRFESGLSFFLLLDIAGRLAVYIC